MRPVHKPLFISCCVAVFFSLLYISCGKSKDTPVTKCNGVTCYNGGACDINTGNCICKAGFDGTSCETVSRLKFLGNWNVFEKGSITEASQYVLSIQQDTGATGVSIHNFYNYFTTPVKAYVNADTITIPEQKMEGKVIIGKGYIYTSTLYGQFGSISMRYEIIDTATQVVNDFGYYPADMSNPSIWNK